MCCTEYYSAARMALKLSRQCERQANEFDADWRKHMLSEARRHRERAAYWLGRHSMKLRIIGEYEDARARSEAA